MKDGWRRKEKREGYECWSRTGNERDKKEHGKKRIKNARVKEEGNKEDGERRILLDGKRK